MIAVAPQPLLLLPFRRDRQNGQGRFAEREVEGKLARGWNRGVGEGSDRTGWASLARGTRAGHDLLGTAPRPGATGRECSTMIGLFRMPTETRPGRRRWRVRRA